MEELTGKSLREGSVVNSFPKHLKFLSRDEKNDLWVTKEKPSVIEQGGQKFLSFGPSGLEDIDNVFSLAVFNHMFKYLKPLDIMELND